MAEDGAVRHVIDDYLSQVAARLAGEEPRQRETLLRELRNHIGEALTERAGAEPPTVQDAYAVLAEMAPPEEYGCEEQHPLPSAHAQRDLTALAVTCALLQTAGLASVIAGIHVVPAVAGFAAVVAFFVARARGNARRWQLYVHGAAAACGVGLILFDVAAAL